MWTGIAFGAFIAFVGVGQLGRAASNGGGAGAAVGLIAIGAASAALFARVALVTDTEGVRIRNLVHTLTIPWDRIERFRIGRYKMLSAVCIIDLADGESVHAFAIQVPRIRRRAESKEQQQVDRLNKLLVSHRAA